MVVQANNYPTFDYYFFWGYNESDYFYPFNHPFKKKIFFTIKVIYHVESWSVQPTNYLSVC